MNQDAKSGQYLDPDGNPQQERRKSPRRKKKAIINHHDRRTAGRRKSDQEFDARETREAIADALEELEDGAKED